MHKFKKGKPRFLLVVLVVAFFVIPCCASASIVFEVTDWMIIGPEGVNFEFTADQTPYTYQVTLTDLSEAPYFGFEYLYLSITTSTETLGSITGPGNFTFPVVCGETYFANVFGIGGGLKDTGLFGLEIKSVPIPGTVLLFGSGVIGLVVLRRKSR